MTEEAKPRPEMKEVVVWTNELFDGIVTKIQEKYESHGGAQSLALWIVTSRALGSSYISMRSAGSQANADMALTRIAEMTTELLKTNGIPATVLITRAESAISTWTIYEKPKDHPEHFVVRKWLCYPGNPVPMPTAEFKLEPTLEEARKHVPKGASRIPRQEKDDPVIVETWL